MFNLKLSLLPICFYCVILAPLLSAQNKNDNRRLANISLIDRNLDIPKELLVISNNKQLKVKLRSANSSLPFNIPKGEVTLLFCPATLDLNNVESIHDIGLPQITIPAEMDRVMLFAYNDNSNKHLPLKFRCINASDDYFKNGDLMFINNTSLPLAGIVDNKKLLLKPGESKILKLQKERESDLFSARFFSKDEYSKKLFSKTWVYSNHTRVVINFISNEHQQISYNTTVIRFPSFVAK